MNPSVLVLGLGISGRSAAALLLGQGYSVIGVDRNREKFKEQQVLDLVEQGLKLFTEEELLPEYSQIVLSPGIPLTHPIVQKAQCEVIGEVELGFRNVQNRCVGITGSNGKTTSVLLLTHVLNAVGKKARALGNVGFGLCQYLLDPDPEEILIVELSSFQIETLYSKKLDFAAVLNILPNHLDRYPSMQAYREAKMGIARCLKSDGKFFQGNDAAFQIAKQFAVTEKEWENGSKSFKKPPHRIEWVAQIDQVAYYNDSKSSNVDASLYALSCLEGPIVLIVGGTDKGSDYRPWIEGFKGKVIHVVAYGLAAEKIEGQLDGAFPFSRVGPFQEAVFCARKLAPLGGTVLLSPGCSSYDQFKNFEARGDAFKKIVQEF